MWNAACQFVLLWMILVSYLRNVCLIQGDKGLFMWFSWGVHDFRFVFILMMFFFCTQISIFLKPSVENTNPFSTILHLPLYQNLVFCPVFPLIEVSGRIQIELILFLLYVFGKIHHEVIWAWSNLYELGFNYKFNFFNRTIHIICFFWGELGWFVSFVDV